MKITKPFYGWYIVFASFVIAAAALGFHNTVSLYVVPVTEELGLSRGEFTFFRTISLLVGAGLLPVYAKFTRQYNIKYVMLIGSTLNGLVFMSYSFAGELWHFYALGVVNGLFLNASQFMVIGVLINRWFIHKKGLALGISLAGSGFGAALMIPLASFVIEYYGWRWGFRFAGFASLLVVIPTIAWLVKPTPESMGLKALTKEAPKELPTDEPQPSLEPQGLTLKEARQTKLFWVLVVTMMCAAMGASVPNSHGVPHFTDLGHDPAFVSAIASTVMVVLIFAKIGLGILFDKKGTLVGGLTLGVFYLLSPLFALLGTNLISPWLHAVSFGIASAGFSIPVGIYASKYFGEKDFASILSFLSMVLSFSGAFAVPTMGMIFDTTGSYTMGWFILMGLALVFCTGVITMAGIEKKNQ